MQRAASIALILLVAACSVTPPIGSTDAAPARAECRLGDADLIANRSLTWQQFDQQATTPTSWRSLMARGCYDTAVIAYADYLAYGPIPQGERWQTSARFHLGQSLASAGRTNEAARIMATARRETEVGGLRWNLYVQGTYAFLMRDRVALANALTELKLQPGQSNAINAGVLSGLLHCWDKPYQEAATPACVRASGYVSPLD
jgi:hypothetical protein